MHAIFAARAIIGNQRPRTRREAILQEEKFYRDMAAASQMARLFSALINVVKARSRRSMEEGDKGCKSTGCDEAQPKGQLPALVVSAGNGNGARAAMCRSVHARAPDEKLNRPMPLLRASSVTSCAAGSLSDPALLAFGQDDSSPVNRLFKERGRATTLPTETELANRSHPLRHPGLVPGSSAIKPLIAKDSSRRRSAMAGCRIKSGMTKERDPDFSTARDDHANSPAACPDAQAHWKL